MRRARLAELTLPGDAKTARRLLRRHCPTRPGVYGMLDAEGQLIYVGKAKSLVDRLLSYFSAAADEKAGRIVEHARRLVWEPAPHEFVALVRELELIRRFLPRFNSRGRPRRRSRMYLAFTSGPAPRLVLGYDPPPGARVVHGPLRSTRHTRKLAELVCDHFRLRTCAQDTPLALADQRELFDAQRAPRCLRRELTLCLAPCAGGCTRADYLRQVRAAADFLAGREAGELERLESAMREAAAAERFEHAAVARDAWTGLAELYAYLERLREVRTRWRFVYPVAGFRGREIWFLIEGGQLAAAVSPPVTPQEQREFLELLDRVYSPGPRRVDPGRSEDADMLLLVSEWFRRYPAESQRTIALDAIRQQMANC
jgi:excinuclease ABC subunit C